MAVSPLLAQQGTIRGKVTDSEFSSPLLGANLHVVGTARETVTDREGSFGLSVSPGSHTLQVTFIGYQSARRAVENAARDTVEVDFELVERALTADEVVVVGSRTVRTALGPRRRSMSFPRARSAMRGGAQFYSIGGLSQGKAPGSIACRAASRNGWCSSSTPTASCPRSTRISGSLFQRRRARGQGSLGRRFQRDPGGPTASRGTSRIRTTPPWGWPALFPSMPGALG